MKVEAGFTLDALKSTIIKIVGEEQKFRLRCGKTYLTGKIEDLGAAIAGRKVNMIKQENIPPARQQQLNLLAGRTHNTLKVLRGTCVTRHAHSPNPRNF